MATWCASAARGSRGYGYSATGRLESVRTLASDLDIRIPYASDPAGNRLPAPAAPGQYTHGVAG